MHPANNYFEHQMETKKKRVNGLRWVKLDRIMNKDVKTWRKKPTSPLEKHDMWNTTS